MGSTITYHDRLRRARLDAGLTQPVLAERCASSTSTISAVERGTRDATAPLLFAWVRACGASLDWIASDPVRVPASGLDEYERQVSVEAYERQQAAMHSVHA